MTAHQITFNKYIVMDNRSGSGGSFGTTPLPG